MLMNDDDTNPSAREYGDYSTMVHGDDGMKMASNNNEEHTPMDNMDSMQMSMTFYTGKGFHLLFESFHIVSDADFILVCIVHISISREYDIFSYLL